MASRFPLPTLDEQRAIADYLDAETARIDALIAKKQQLIHLLEERLEARRKEEFPARRSSFGCDSLLTELWMVRTVRMSGLMLVCRF